MKHNHAKRYPMSSGERRCIEIAMKIAMREPENAFRYICMGYACFYGRCRIFRNKMRDYGKNPYKDKSYLFDTFIRSIRGA